MKKRLKHITVFIITAAALVGIMYLLQLLVVPKYVGAMRDGSLVEEYYSETKDHDVVFIGDCEVYENFSPVTLWQEYGITSYIRGSAQQLIWQSYYLLEETLLYEKPGVVVFNVLSMKYGEPQNEAYNRLTLDGMRMSDIKLKAIEASMMEDESVLTYVFPFFRYHSRWSELNEDDWKYMFGKGKISHNGYLLRADVKPLKQPPIPMPLVDYTLSDVCYNYLDRMTKLCGDNGIELILIKAPIIYPHWYDEWDEQIAGYAEENDIRFINFLKLMDEAGIDMSKDTYDSGLHLNVYGAEKLSRYFGNMLREEYGLEDRRGDAQLSEIWAEKIDFYYQDKAAQLAELEQYGYLKSLTLETKEEK